MKRFFSQTGPRHDPEMSQVHIDGLLVEVVRKRIRRLNLSVRAPEGSVRVAAPIRSSDAEIRRFVADHRDWVERHRVRIRERARQIRPAPRFNTGEIHEFRGRPYPLTVIETGDTESSSPSDPAGSASMRREGGIRLIDGDSPQIRLFVRAGASSAERAAIMADWYRKELRALIPPVLARWEAVVGVEVMTWGIKRMKTKWGTCNPRARRIWINLDLAQKPAHLLDYIMVHELTHILEPSHNSRFKSLMDRFLPAWREHRRELKRSACATQ